jgi:recombinational DNA repair protein (RecF pathway)
MRSITHPKAAARRDAKPNSSHCSRCRREAPTRGRFTQTIRGEKRFICAECCSTLSSVGALIAHAEASEREETRRRFTERLADRREAA